MEPDDEETMSFHAEWEQHLERQSIAKTSLCKLRRTHPTTYFTKGKLNDIGFFLKENTDISVVFINTVLTPLQRSKLEKRWNDII